MFRLQAAFENHEDSADDLGHLLVVAKHNGNDFGPPDHEGLHHVNGTAKMRFSEQFQTTSCV